MHVELCELSCVVAAHFYTAVVQTEPTIQDLPMATLDDPLRDAELPLSPMTSASGDMGTPMHYRESASPLTGRSSSASGEVGSSKSKATEFYTDWNAGRSGILRADTEIPKNSFAMRLVALVEADSITGYFAEVMRELDKKTRVCFFTADAVSNKTKFLSQINQSFASGGMTSALDNVALIEYFQYLQRSHTEPLPIKKAVMSTGHQDDGTWVFNSDTFLSPDGEILSPSESDLVWLNRDFVCDGDKIRSEDISPRISLPLTVDRLKELVCTIERISKHNFLPTIVVIAGTVLSFHYEAVVEAYGGCPITVALGESETGKSTAIRAGLSLFGCDEISRYVKGTTAAFMERASRSTMPFAIEEAKGKGGKSKANQVDLTELIVDLHNGSRTANLRTGSVKPRSIPILATNFDVDQMERVRSRVLLVPFELPSVGPETSNEFEAFEIFEEALLHNYYSSTVGWVVGLRELLRIEGREKIHDFKEELRQFFGAKIRSTIGWAVCLFFVSHAVGRSELMTEVKLYVANKVAPLYSGSSRATLMQQGAPDRAQAVVVQCCQELSEAAQSMTLPQRLQFMRTETEVDSREVFAVWMKVGMNHITATQPAFTDSVKRSGSGRNQEKRDFSVNATDGFITKGINHARRNCTAIFLDRLPPKLATTLKQLTKQDKTNSQHSEPTIGGIRVKQQAGKSSMAMDAVNQATQPRTPMDSCQDLHVEQEEGDSGSPTVDKDSLPVSIQEPSRDSAPATTLKQSTQPCIPEMDSCQDLHVEQEKGDGGSPTMGCAAATSQEPPLIRRSSKRIKLQDEFSTFYKPYAPKRLRKAPTRHE